MDSIISLGQKNTLAEYMILSGADNRPPMLEKDLYDSWKSRMKLYMQNREHGRMILESVENALLIWPTIEEDGVIRTKKYAELSAAEKIQADCDMKATNIILQGLPADIYSLVNHHKVDKDLWERVQLLMQGTSLTKHERECFAVLVFSPGDEPIACLNKAMAFLTAVASKPKRPRNAAWYKEKAMLTEAQEAGQILDEEQLAFLADLGIPADQAQTIIPHNAAFQTEDLDTYDLNWVPNSETYLNDMDNQSVHALKDFEQTPVMDFTDNEISSDSNIIPYYQYLQETQ
ncbi:hypothetical protein Tco_1229803 [Tanacetum coccineum]